LEQGRLYVVQGRSRIERLAGGESTAFTFRVRASGDLEANPVDVKLWVTDTLNRRSFSWTVPIGPADADQTGGTSPSAGAWDATPALYQPGFELETVRPAEGAGDAAAIHVQGIIDYGPRAGDGDVLAAYVNGEKRSVVSFEAPKAGPLGLHRFSLDLPLEVGPNRIVLSAIRKGQSQSFVELMYNRLR
jgi:hypothetical protein